MLHSLCKEGCDMSYPFWLMVDIKDRVLLICKTTHEVAAVGFLSCYLNGHINIPTNASQLV